MTHAQRQGSMLLNVCALPWLAVSPVSQWRGLKYGGLIKADYKGGECAGIRLRSAQWWLHPGSAAASSSLSSPCTCNRAAASTNDPPAGKSQKIKIRDDILPRQYYVDLSWLSSLWLLTWSAQRLTMLFIREVHQAQFHSLCHLFKPAFNYLFLKQL